jgi:hypothetical protein
MLDEDLNAMVGDTATLRMSYGSRILGLVSLAPAVVAAVLRHAHRASIRESPGTTATSEPGGTTTSATSATSVRCRWLVCLTS